MIKRCMEHQPKGNSIYLTFAQHVGNVFRDTGLRPAITESASVEAFCVFNLFSIKEMLSEKEMEQLDQIRPQKQIFI